MTPKIHATFESTLKKSGFRLNEKQATEDVTTFGTFRMFKGDVQVDCIIASTPREDSVLKRATSNHPILRACVCVIGHSQHFGHVARKVLYIACGGLTNWRWEMRRTKLTAGLLIGLMVGWATGAQASGWFSNPSIPRASSPADAPIETQRSLYATGRIAKQFAKYFSTCKSTPICGNGYILSADPCPNTLPGDLPSNAYPVKSCYACTTPTKVASLADDKLCVAEHYGNVKGWGNVPWGKGFYTCAADSTSTPAPTSYIKLCPEDMGAENFGTYKAWTGKDIEERNKYDCRFAVADESICDQCGTIAMPGGNKGEVYCVLPSNLPPPDPNKPCGK